MDDYLPLVFTFALAVVFILGSIVTTKFVAPRRPTSAKAAPYESGIVPTREPPTRFPVRFYLVAMIFIIFDIEVIFVYPWAVIYRELRAFGLWEMVLFAVAVFVSFVFLIGNGALDWGPVKRIRPLAELPESMRSADRTAETTVRRVDVGRQEPAA